MNVLIIEDEKKVSSFIKNGLGREGFAIEVASDGREGLRKAYNPAFDIKLFLT